MVTLDGPETVRTQVVRALGRLYAVPNPDLRVLFEERDAELLDTPAIGHRVDIQATNSPATSKVGLRTYVFAGDRLLVRTDDQCGRAGAAQRADCLGADRRGGRGYGGGLRRGGAVAGAVGVGCRAPASRRSDQSPGRGSTRGQVITQVNVEAPVIVKKGEIVEIHCLSGAIHVKASAGAGDGGRARRGAGAVSTRRIEAVVQSPHERARLGGDGC